MNENLGASNSFPVQFEMYPKGVMLALRVKKPTFASLIFMDPCIVDDSVEIPTKCRFVIEFIIPKFIEDSTCFEQHTAHHQEL
jgi:hypothetical protein